MSLRSDSIPSSELILRVDELKKRLVSLDAFVHGHVDFRHKLIRYSAPAVIKKWPIASEKPVGRAVVSVRYELPSLLPAFSSSSRPSSSVNFNQQIGKRGSLRVQGALIARILFFRYPTSWAPTNPEKEKGQFEEDPGSISIFSRALPSFHCVSLLFNLFFVFFINFFVFLSTALAPISYNFRQKSTAFFSAATLLDEIEITPSSVTHTPGSTAPRFSASSANQSSSNSSLCPCREDARRFKWFLFSPFSSKIRSQIGDVASGILPLISSTHNLLTVFYWKIEF